MDVIKIYNYKIGEILEKTFSDQGEADDLETILDFIGAEYERFHNGEQWYSKAPSYDIIRTIQEKRG